jgi:hypothetical protein
MRCPIDGVYDNDDLVFDRAKHEYREKEEDMSGLEGFENQEVKIKH